MWRRIDFGIGVEHHQECSMHHSHVECGTGLSRPRLYVCLDRTAYDVAAYVHLVVQAIDPHDWFESHGTTPTAAAAICFFPGL